MAFLPTAMVWRARVGVSVFVPLALKLLAFVPMLMLSSPKCDVAAPLPTAILRRSAELTAESLPTAIFVWVATAAAGVAASWPSE
jgi:hypothetical protein